MTVAIVWLMLAYPVVEPTGTYNESTADSEFLCQVEDKLISTGLVCDGVIDCRMHGEDELHCEDWTCAKEFWKCANNKQCIRLDDVCNRKDSVQCFDQSDESFETCLAWECDPDLEWKCPTEECIPKEWVCDGTEWWLPDACQNMAEEDPEHCVNWTCTPGRYVSI